jgi:hypothetical protein
LSDDALITLYAQPNGNYLVNSQAVSNDAQQFTIGDFNRDGFADLALMISERQLGLYGYSYTGNIEVFTNNRLGLLHSSQIINPLLLNYDPIFSRPFDRIFAGDFQGDGGIDI